MRKAKIFSFFTAIILLMSLFCGSLTSFAAFTPKFALHSEGVYMVNLDTDIVVVSKNPDKKLYPASTTKIMTCLVALENIKDFDAKVKYTYDATNEFFEGNPNYKGASEAGLDSLQDNLTYWDCLYGLMLKSGCECANILAYNICDGNIDQFIALMNKTAKKIGCKNTHFSNTHGLFNEENYTTVYDMYLITKYAMENYPAFMKIAGSYTYDMPPNSRNPEGYTISHTNQLMNPGSSLYYEGVKGLKTGSIDYYYYQKDDGSFDTENPEEGSRALVTVCERNGYTYMIVTMGAPFHTPEGELSSYNFDDHVALYDWAFNDFEYTLVIGKNEQIMQVDVDKGKDVDEVGIVATEDYYTLLPKSLDLTTIQQIRPTIEMLEAPIEKGMMVGKLELKLSGETLAKLSLVTEQDVELDMNEYYKEKLLDIINTPQFYSIVAILAVLLVVYGIANIKRKKFKQKVAESKRRKIQMSPQNRNTPKHPNNYKNNTRR